MPERISVLLSCVLFLVSANSLEGTASDVTLGGRIELTLRQAAEDEAKPEMTNAEKIARWIGEKLTFLDEKPLGCPGRHMAMAMQGALESAPDKGEPGSLDYSSYVGQTGVILEAKMGPTEPRIVIKVDKTGEKVVAKSDWGLGFQTEFDAAKEWVGRSLWSKGAQTIERRDQLCVDFDNKAERISLKHLEKVTITGVEFGTHLQGLYFFVKTENGQEGSLDGYEGYDYLGGRFHLLDPDATVPVRPYSYRFYSNDPRKMHPDWSGQVWKLIEGGEVAIGMTGEMAEVACGREMKVIGFVLPPSGAGTSAIYECNKRRFLLEKGTVTKFVDER